MTLPGLSYINTYATGLNFTYHLIILITKTNIQWRNLLIENLIKIFIAAPNRNAQTRTGDLGLNFRSLLTSALDEDK